MAAHDTVVVAGMPSALGGGQMLDEVQGAGGCHQRVAHFFGPGMLVDYEAVNAAVEAFVRSMDCD